MPTFGVEVMKPNVGLHCLASMGPKLAIPTALILYSATLDLSKDILDNQSYNT